MRISDQPRYVCPLCLVSSPHPQDIDNRYCFRCHRYEDSPITMAEHRQIIMLINQDAHRDPRFANVEWTPSIHHQPIDCPSCGRACWIGPSQAALLTGRGAEALCLICMLERAQDDPALADAIMHERNPANDREPRRR